MGLTYFRRNVPYRVGIIYYIGDEKGKILDNFDPYVAIEDADLNDFLNANRILLDDGVLMKTSEPSFEILSPNFISDEKAEELVKNVFVLKKALVDITSESMVSKILEVAKERNRPKKTIELIEARLKEVSQKNKGAYPEIIDGEKIYRNVTG